MRRRHFGAAAFAVIITGINDGARGQVICGGVPSPMTTALPASLRKAVVGTVVIEAQPISIKAPAGCYVLGRARRTLQGASCLSSPTCVRSYIIKREIEFVYFSKTDQMSKKNAKAILFPWYLFWACIYPIEPPRWRTLITTATTLGLSSSLPLSISIMILPVDKVLLGFLTLNDEPASRAAAATCGNITCLQRLSESISLAFVSASCKIRLLYG